MTNKTECVNSKQDVTKSNTLYEILRKLGAERFYGELTLKYESGNIVYVKKTETIKIK